MKDREFLIWLHERLEYRHNENMLYGYMHKLRNIIKSTDPDKETLNILQYNSLEELKKDLNL